ncbi:MAG: HAD-IIIA family hydrolase [Verrucomicrobiaceae bacterium]
MHPAFFFDRDGVVNRSPGDGYVLRPEDFHFNEGIIEALSFIKSRGFKLILVTSQQGVGKGLMSQAVLDDIHNTMQTELGRHRAAFDGIYACTCLANMPDCTCRKPSAEMVLKAEHDFNVDLAQSWLVGDHDRDIQMGHNAGIKKTIRITDGAPAITSSTYVLSNIGELLPLLKKLI